MTCNEMIEFVKQHPNTQFIIRDNNNDKQSYRACVIIKYRDNTLFMSHWGSVKDIISSEATFAVSSLPMCNSDGVVVNTGRDTNCSILSPEEITMALL